ncbi:carbohydrate esterase family 1 protein [Bipolaris oryzae ATCC 44560]|uniref:Carboxylic ester hydrolase n=1 Tax=Bipolaris oryzae ATCC 44560 TaxID=930090 RepID=W6YUB7_COCMI|nr:carbohydrate esterase family 1 protein [Bipolaris oryzae ATCC 44560]EUC41118.1 carbohydrate esterase family 1 protein [Bipolaris oryzae ATCC 44560]
MKFLISLLACGSAAFAAQLTQVSNYGGSAKARPGMYVYKPDQVKSDALVVAIHPCGSTGQSYFGWAPWKKGSDSKGYVTVFPSATASCWDVSSKASLSRGGGGESNAIADMIAYATKQYNLNPKKVYVVGESSGAMMTNVLAATYPDLIAATSVYSGVAAGCFVSASGGVAAWNSECAQGRSIKTAQQWGDIARAMDPGYNGSRPRVQFWHGSVDATILPPNYNETLKQWTNVFGVSTTPTRSQANTPQTNYRTDDFGSNVQGIWAVGVGHGVPAHQAQTEAWFGL